MAAVPPTSSLLRPFTRPSDLYGVVVGDDRPPIFLGADVPPEVLSSGAVARLTLLDSWLGMMVCSKHDLTYTPDEMAEMVLPLLADVRILVEALDGRLKAAAGAMQAVASTLELVKKGPAHG